MSRFAQSLLSGRPITTAEVLTPAGVDPDALRALSLSVPSFLDAVIVADNPDRIRSSAFSAAVELSRQKAAGVILSMTTRDRNRLALMSDALGAAALGIEGILCMSGRHGSIDICPEAAAAGDFDSIQFVQAMKKMVLDGADPKSKKKEPALNLQIGATVHPYLRPLQLNLMCVQKKISVGADFLVTQVVFDLEEFENWMAAVRKKGLDKRTAIIASVLPLSSVEQARTLQRSGMYGPIGDDIVDRISAAPDPAAEGLSIAAEIANILRGIRGVRGIHVIGGCCGLFPAEMISEKAGWKSEDRGNGNA